MDKLAHRGRYSLQLSNFFHKQLFFSKSEKAKATQETSGNSGRY